MNSALKRFTSYFFFSNIFLGLTAVVLCIETNLQSNISLNFFPFYILIFLGTCLYYTIIYVRSIKAVNYNERTLWYRRNLSHIVSALNFIVAGVTVFALVIFFRNMHRFHVLSPLQWTLLALFPLLAAWYTLSARVIRIKNIRRHGMLKPFIIGLTWSGFVTVYPILIWQIQYGASASGHLFPPFIFWLQSFLFFSILSIIFDIKDHSNDESYRLITFPVALGIRKTMSHVALPLFIINYIVFIAFQVQQQFNVYQVSLQSIPYVLLLFVIIQHDRPKNLLYYLAGIDGLMMLKAACGITAILFLKNK